MMLLIVSTILNRGLLKYVFIMDYNAHMNKDLTQGRQNRGPGGFTPQILTEIEAKILSFNSIPPRIFRPFYGPVFEIVGAMPAALLTAAPKH